MIGKNRKDLQLRFLSFLPLKQLEKSERYFHNKIYLISPVCAVKNALTLLLLHCQPLTFSTRQMRNIPCIHHDLPPPSPPLPVNSLHTQPATTRKRPFPLHHQKIPTPRCPRSLHPSLRTSSPFSSSLYVVRQSLKRLGKPAAKEPAQDGSRRALKRPRERERERKRESRRDL